MVADSGGASVEPAKARHIRLTSHSAVAGTPTIRWGAASAAERGPVIGTTTTRAHRNVIGTHSGSYSVYRALAVAAGTLSPGHRADLTPDDARVEIDAKMAAGYFTPGPVPGADELKMAKGRGLA